ncbi:MAG: sugar ABC transporter ATP-binding protein [Candidatus Hydrogenedentota bacterium]
MDSLLTLSGISKRYGATQALDDVDLDVQAGEVHALIGENGAGKSTLVKVLSGAIQADEGSIKLDGSRVVIRNPAAGRALGIAMIYQELTLAPHLTVEDNLTLGLEESKYGFAQGQREAIADVLALVGHPDLPLTRMAGELSISLQQVVEIARALMSNAKVIIMDEPTSSLTATDTKALFEAIGRLRDSGITIIYISHFLEEVMEIADQYTILRDGAVVDTGEIGGTTMELIIAGMVGRELTEMFPPKDRDIGEVLLEVKGVRGSLSPEEVSFTLHRGEIFGIAGLVGAGRTETLRCLFGLDKAKKGTIRIGDGDELMCFKMSPARARLLRLDLLSENRKEEGLATRMTIAENTTLSTLSRFARAGGWGLLSLKKESAAVERHIEAVGIRCEGAEQVCDQLSGGNQQKVAFARIVEQDAEVLLLDEPTRGVDVGSKVEIYKLINRFSSEGKGIVFVSSYLPELLGVCDRIAVMHRGRLSEARSADDWTEHEIMRIATSGV